MGKRIEGSVHDWTFTTLNTSTYEAVKLPDGASVGSVAYYTEDETDIYIAKDVSGTDARLWNTRTSGESLGSVKAIDSDGTIFFAKAVSGTPKLVCLYQKLQGGL